MKNLIISIVCLLLLIVPWGIYEKYSSKEIHLYTNILNEQVLPSIESGKWQKAENNFLKVMNNWEKYKNVSAYFINNSSINEVDSQISETYYYIKENDFANAAAETASLIYSLYYLHENEQPSKANLL